MPQVHVHFEQHTRKVFSCPARARELGREGGGGERVGEREKELERERERERETVHRRRDTHTRYLCVVLLDANSILFASR